VEVDGVIKRQIFGTVKSNFQQCDTCVILPHNTLVIIT